MEKALKEWVNTWDERGFPARLDLFKAVAAQLVESRAQEEGASSPVRLGSPWLGRFLSHHPAYSTKYVVNLDRQQALVGDPALVKDYFRKLGNGLKKYAFKPENMYNTDEKGSLLGYNNRAKVTVRRRRCMPTEHRMDQENGLRL